MARMQEAIATLQEAMRRQAEQDKENAELANRQAKMRESIKGVAAEYVCPLTLELLVDPVVAKDGQIYERSHILAWLSRNATIPVTREPMGTELTPVPRIRNSIEKLVSSGAIEGEIAEAWQKASAKKLADETKVKETRAKAEGGDAEAMWQLGAWYQDGVNGLAQDDVQARTWFVRAKAEGGDGEAMWLLGKWYQHGAFGLAKDNAQARAWLERSAAARDPRGLATFGFCLLCGIGGPKDNVFGIVNVTEAAHLGSDLGAYWLGEWFFKGELLPKDPARARFWLEKVVNGECAHKHMGDNGKAKAAGWLRELESAGE